MAKFKIGDTVVLVSGGPLMTVETIDEFVKTIWFNQGMVNRDAFDDISLIKIKEAE